MKFGQKGGLTHFSSLSSYGHWMHMVEVVTFGATNCLKVFSAMFISITDSDKGSKDMFITVGGIVSMVALDDEDTPSVEHPNGNLLHNLCKFLSTFRSI